MRRKDPGPKKEPGKPGRKPTKLPKPLVKPLQIGPPQRFGPSILTAAGRG
jgi:hypothetical protein